MNLHAIVRLTGALLVFSSLVLSRVAHSQSVKMGIDGLLHGLNEVETNRILKTIDVKQQDARTRIAVQQAELDKLRLDDRNPTEAKSSLLNFRLEGLEETRKRYVILETAKLAVTGQDIPKPLAEYFPDVIESIASLANPVLPLCGKQLTYRGDSNQVSWNLTLDKFLSKYGDLLSAVGRIELDLVTYTQGPSGPQETTVRINVGTGFAVSPKEVVTAGHVAAMFWDFDAKSLKQRVRNVYFNPGGEHRFGCNSSGSHIATRKLASVSRTKYQPASPANKNLLDYAVLDLASGESELERVLPVAQGSPAISAFVVVVGYPSDDPRVDRETWRTMMQVPVEGGMFPVADIKRIAPGMVIPKCANAQPVHVPHNATTLNRSSGAPIIAVDSGEVVGIQVAGYRDLGGDAVYCNLGLRSNAPDVSLK